MIEQNNNQFKRKILYLIWLITIVAFLLLPTRVNFRIDSYCVCFILYILALLLFFLIKQKKNYFDFDTIFLIISSLMFFLAPFYAENEIFPRLFIVGFDSDLIIKGTLLASVGLESYMIGSVIKYNPPQKTPQINFPKGEIFAQLFILCSIIFVLSGGIDFYRSTYNSEYSQDVSPTGLIQQMIPLMVVFANLYCVSVFLKFQKCKQQKWLYLIYIFLFSFVIALIGNRTLFSNIVLPFVLCYFSFVKNLSWRKSSVLFMIGVFFMSIIQITRTGDSYYSRSLILMFTDLTIPSSTLYNTLEYVDINGITYLKTMLAPLIGCVPGMGSMFANINSYSSASVLTEYMITDSWMEGVGMGSTIISDLYLGSGIIGVVFFMIILGRWINILNNNKGLNYMIVECAFFASCIFMCRSSYFYPTRFIIWSLLVIYGYNFLIKCSKRNY